MQTSSLTTQAYELIKQQIITCEIAPGEQIAQAQLVEKLGLGISPVRDALQRLTQEGFVQPIPRFGYLISPVTISDVQEIFELRSILEIAAVRLAAERGSDESIKKLVQEANFTYIYHNRETYTAFLNRNDQFHNEIAKISGNQRLVDAVSKVLGELMRVFHLGLDLRDSAEEMREEHIELVNALTLHDVNRAEAIIRKQISRSQERIIEALMQRFRNNRDVINTKITL
jgi:DNA-binding GntR family transcriptional regulator